MKHSVCKIQGILYKQGIVWWSSLLSPGQVRHIIDIMTSGHTTATCGDGIILCKGFVAWCSQLENEWLE